MTHQEIARRIAHGISTHRRMSTNEGQARDIYSEHDLAQAATTIFASITAEKGRRPEETRAFLEDCGFSHEVIEWVGVSDAFPFGYY